MTLELALIIITSIVCVTIFLTAVVSVSIYTGVKYGYKYYKHSAHTHNEHYPKN